MNSEQVFAALERHVHHQDEMELLLLKGHLILERCLNELLRFYISNPADAEKLNLTFARKLDLLVALGHRLYSPGTPGATQIKEINRIRNKLAHGLDFNDYHADLKAWACSVIGHTPSTLNRRATYLNTVKRAFYVLTSFLCGVAEAKQDIKRHAET
jgi:hypothetical protein